MRIAIATQYYPPETGAPQVRLSAVARCLIRRGHQVEVVTGMPNHPRGRIFPGYRRRCSMVEERDGIRVVRVWLYPAIGGGLARMINYLTFALMLPAGLMRLRRRPQLLLVESPPLFIGLPALVWARLQRVPVAFNVADLWPDSLSDMGFGVRSGLYRVLARLERWCYARSATVVAVTESNRVTLHQRKGVPRELITFLPNSVDEKLFAPRDPEPELARELGIEDQQLIVYAGTIGLAQGLDIAIRAVHALSDRYPRLRLILLGDGSDRRRLMKLVAELQTDRVRFLDPRPPEFVPRILALASAGLVSLVDLPVFRGVRPSKIFPIMACAKAVIFSGPGEGSRLVEAADAGWVVPAADVEALSAAIEAVLEDPQEAARRGANGRHFVCAQLTWNRSVEAWLRQVGGVLRRGAR